MRRARRRAVEGAWRWRYLTGRGPAAVALAGVALAGWVAGSAVAWALEDPPLTLFWLLYAAGCAAVGLGFAIVAACFAARAVTVRVCLPRRRRAR